MSNRTHTMNNNTNHNNTEGSTMDTTNLTTIGRALLDADKARTAACDAAAKTRDEVISAAHKIYNAAVDAADGHHIVERLGNSEEAEATFNAAVDAAYDAFDATITAATEAARAVARAASEARYAYLMSNPPTDRNVG